MQESDIIHTAVDSLKKETGASIEVTKSLNTNGLYWDGMIAIKAHGIQTKFKVEVKNRVHQANMLQLIDTLTKERSLLIAAYISQPGKDLLEQKGINYLDVAGNCFIKSDEGIFWKINNLRAKNSSPSKKHRIFHKNGIKLILSLLIDDNLINEPYRVQAQAANISVSTVGGIHEDLKAAKFLFQLNDKKKKLANKDELLSQWVENYQQRLKPKLFRGRFRFLNSTARDWKNINLPNRAFWSGEPAADALTNFLEPELLTLYTNMDRGKLISELKLIPDSNGSVEVNSIFWNLENNLLTNATHQIVHPILVYADLLSSGDSRNIETAKRIYEQHLQDILK